MAIICELCGNTDFVKEDGMFVCKGCNTKYSLEEAKKMMETGEVTVNNHMSNNSKSDEMKNLYELARRAKNDGNDENAQKFYEQILVKDPSAWEPNFYSTYYQVRRCKIGEIGSAAIKLNNSEKTVLELLRDEDSDDDIKIKALKEITEKMISICDMLFYGYKNHYDGINYQIKANYNNEMLSNCGVSMLAIYNFADEIINVFGEDFCPECAVNCWKHGINLHMALRAYYFVSKEDSKNAILKYVEKIQKYEPDYAGPDFNSASSGGCYVATAVYGSYDCPEVWTLRRYRDYTLAESIFGRAFIHTYYAISPTLVKWFGHTEWFKKMWKSKLDYMVAKLQDNGYESTPYIDKKW